MNYKKINYDFIEAYCIEKKEVAWLKAILSTPIVKDGKEREITFIELKKAFCEKFMPELLPVAKPKPLSMFERANLL